jgi:tRNA-Thr(GGU) m(6)t(6)A37 methyltransferase TsaA
MEITFNPIGVIHTPFKEAENMPIQPSGAKGIKGFVEINTEFVDGLKDLDGFSHIILIYHFHKVNKKTELTVKPFLDSQLRGLFATRAPNRPNKIGISVVKLLKIEHNIIHIENIDIIDGTPLLDIKPYVPEFDEQSSVSVGWLEKAKGEVRNKKSDNRFE